MAWSSFYDYNSLQKLYRKLLIIYLIQFLNGNINKIIENIYDNHCYSQILGIGH